MEALTVGKIAVHEFITIDGVFEDPSFTFDYPFDPKMGVAIARIMGSSKAILLGRRTHEMFAPGWSGKLEYDYLGFGSNSYALGFAGTSVDTHVQLIKAGVNYHLLPGGFFGWF